MKPTTATQIAAAIARLEGQLPQLVQDTQQAELVVADEMADPEGKPDSALAKLSRARDLHAAAVRSLTQLDVQLHDAQARERDAAESKLREKLEADIAKFSEALPKALGGFSAILGEDVVAQMTAFALKVGTEALEERRWNSPLPPAPSKPRPRNAAGKPKTDDELNREWSPSGRFSAGDATAQGFVPARDPGAWLAGAQ